MLASFLEKVPFGSSLRPSEIESGLVFRCENISTRHSINRTASQAEFESLADGLVNQRYLIADFVFELAQNYLMIHQTVCHRFTLCFQDSKVPSFAFCRRRRRRIFPSKWGNSKCSQERSTLAADLTAAATPSETPLAARAAAPFRRRRSFSPEITQHIRRLTGDPDLGPSTYDVHTVRGRESPKNSFSK